MRIAALLIATFSLAGCGGRVDSGVEPGAVAALSPVPLTFRLEIPHAQGGSTWALLTNPLHQGMNHVAEVLTNVPSGTTVYKYGSDGLWQIANFENFPGEDPYWSNEDLTLAPGDGFFLFFPNAGAPDPLVINFAGLAPEIGESFTRPVPGPGAFTLVGSMLPRAGKLGEELAFPLSDGDTIYRWNAGTQSYDLFEYPSGGDPRIAMGESVFVQRAGAATTWRQVDTAGWVSSSIARVSKPEPLSGTVEVTVALEATHPALGLCLIAATYNISVIHELGCINGPLWSGEYTFTVDTMLMDNGIWGFQAQSSNNVESTAQHGQNFSVFNDRPGTATSRITSPAASTTINGTVEFRVELTALHAVDEMCLMASALMFPANQQPARNLGCLSNIGSGGHSYLVDTRAMGNGDWSFSATLRSSIDATSATASTVRVNNGVPPGVAESQIISPTAGPSLSGPVTFSVRMSAPHTVEEMCLEGTGPNNATGSFGCHRNILSGTYTYSIDTRYIAEGEWTFRARPVNQIDTINAIASTFTVQQLIATARIVSPMDGATIRGTVEIGISIDQRVEVICLQGYEIATYAVYGNCISGYFQPGTHNITVDTTTMVNGTWNLEPMAYFEGGRMATVRSNLIIAN